MTEEIRVPIERIEESGRVTPGTARMQGVTLDDYRTLTGSLMKLPPGAMFVVVTTVFEERTAD